MNGFLRTILAAFIGALLAGAVMGIAGYVYLDRKVTEINKQVDASFTKAFGVTTGDGVEDNGEDWCRDFYETSGNQGDYAAFKEKNCQ